MMRSKLFPGERGICGIGLQFPIYRSSTGLGPSSPILAPEAAAAKDASLIRSYEVDVGLYHVQVSGISG